MCELPVRCPCAGAEEPVEIQVWSSKVRSELEIELGEMSIRWSSSARIHVIAWGEREEKEEKAQGFELPCMMEVREMKRVGQVRQDAGVRWGEYPERRVHAREGGAHRSTGGRRNTHWI